MSAEEFFDLHRADDPSGNRAFIGPEPHPNETRDNDLWVPTEGPGRVMPLEAFVAAQAGRPLRPLHQWPTYRPHPTLDGAA